MSGIKITWLGHATFQITTPQGTSILLDPWLTGNPSSPIQVEQLEQVDLLLITHGHADHVTDAAAVAKKHNPTVVAIAELIHWLGTQGIANEKLIDMNIGGSFTFKDVTISLTQAHHSSAVTVGEQVIYTGEPVGFVLRIENGPTLYFAGDTDVFGDMALIRELYAPDIALLPIGDHYTMGTRGAALATKLLGVKRVIPMHYATFPLFIGTPQGLREDLQAFNVGEVEVIALTPGQTHDFA
ncbi:metal-dependent hydrolase [Tengunoibacter tsumagoiensis]|uniref:UPF0173 metal-dependent hydrolase KTT_07560 n=1 Tax=Tengunoibacter tsumagoiensis TaxID=2014871 RepID=A0A401ZVL9_9CHLR|nr:metal-dependent hydrolase [Tengunoibacter tsumagoiensis]GCE10897.1 UPF0173 metal-dependent hydrolase [Tengunoibacter tsumagoiensis]